jgi:hypothetical protein
MQGRGGLDATESRLRAVLAIEEKRAEETGALVADLDGQLEALRQVGGDNSRRARQTVWFEWVKVKAEHEFLTAHVASLRQVLGEDGDR